MFSKGCPQTIMHHRPKITHCLLTVTYPQFQVLELADSELELVDSSTNSNADPMRIDEWIQVLRLQRLFFFFYKRFF